jgi:hypothetical protein
VAAGKFSVHAVETVADGVELLMGLPAGERDENGQFPDGSINQRVENKLIAYSEEMRAFISKVHGPAHHQDEASE